MKPSEDEKFMALLDPSDEGRFIARNGADWESVRDELDREIFKLEDELDRLNAAIEYADKQAETEKAGRPAEEEESSGWHCSGCKTGTLSRCLACDEPTCGNCLVTHVCEVAA